MAAGLLGQMYLKGVEVEQNFHTAIRLFRLGEVVDLLLFTKQ